MTKPSFGGGGIGSPSQRNNQPDIGPAANRTGDIHRSAVPGRDTFHNCEAEAQILRRLRPVSVNPVEAFKYVRQMLGRNSASRVAHTDTQLFVVRRCRQVNRAARV